MKRIIVACLVLALMGVTLSGCGADGSPQASPGAPSSNAGSNAGSNTNASREKTLIWGVPELATGLDNDFQYTNQSQETIRNVYDSPLVYELVEHQGGFLVPDFDELKPSLCEEWSLSEDGCTLTMKFKEGLMSHEGNELTADDFIWRWERGFAVQGLLGTFGAQSSAIEDMSQIQKIDEYTVSITTEKPCPAALAMQAHQISIVIDSDAFKANATDGDPWATEWAATHASGYGPFKVVDFVPSDQIILERFEDYWDKDSMPWFEKVIVKEIPESSNRVSMLLSGDIDAATNLNYAELLELQAKEGVKVLHYDGNQIFHMGFNSQVEEFKNPLVRRALSYAVPYESILSSVFMGLAKQATSYLPSIYPGYNGDYWTYSYDLDKAKELLVEAGYADGFTMQIATDNNYPQMEQIAILLKDSFSKVGVEVEIDKMQTGDYYNKIATKSFESAYLCNDAGGTPEPGFVTGLYCVDGANMNMGLYHNDEVEELYAKMNSTVDLEVINECADRLQQILVQEDPIWIYIAEPGFNLAVREEIINPRWDTIMQTQWKYMKRAE